jgi:hypothetical protein
MPSALSQSEMVPDEVLEMEAVSDGRGKRCRHCKAPAADPPLPTIDSHNLHERFLGEACWLLLEIGFSDARPFDDLYQYLSPVEGRLRDAEVYHHILRGRVLLERRGGLVK